MNERIKQLANEVQFTSDVTYTELEKFAELIIQECCDAVRYVDALEIKNHFGVE
jgi:hypothetical protein